MSPRRRPLLLPLVLFLGGALACMCGGKRYDGPPMTEAEAERQRSWLPPAAKGCWDGISGSWVGKSYRDNQWHQYTLRIERMLPSPTRLTGTIIGRPWSGGPGSPYPPKCSGGSPAMYQAYQHATGQVDGDYLEFDGYDVYKKEWLCGEEDRTYYPDRVAGFIQDNDIEFYAYNDDLHNPSGPVLFVRTECSSMPAVFKPLLDLF